MKSPSCVRVHDQTTGSFVNKKSIILVTTVLLVLIGVLGILQLPSPSKISLQQLARISPTMDQALLGARVTPTDMYCLPQDLDASLALDHAAGNVYGSVTIRNISQRTCSVIANHMISAVYDSAKVKNIQLTREGQMATQPFILSPGQTLYSQIHYSNEPQCRSVGLVPVSVFFTYQISPDNAVVFNNAPETIETCTSATDTTEIQLWALSTKPVGE